MSACIGDHVSDLAHGLECIRVRRAALNPPEIERSALVGPEPEAMGPALRSLGVTLFIVSIRGLDLSPLHAWLQWRDAENTAVA